MHPEKVWIVIVILGVILVGSNLLMYGIAKGMKGIRGGNIIKGFDNFTRPWKKEDEGWQELSEKARMIRSTGEKSEDD